MKVKRILLMLVALLGFSHIMNAQKVVSNSQSITVIKEPKKPKVKKPWYFDAKAGFGILDGGSFYCNYGVKVEFVKSFKSTLTGPYWGVQLGVTGSMDEMDYYYFEEEEFKNCIFGGAQIGYKHPINPALTFDIDLGTNYGYAIGADHCDRFILQLEPGLWIKKFYVGLQGVVQVGSYDSVYYGGLIQVGYRF